MPRSKTGIKRTKFHKADLEEAVKAVLDGKSYREVSIDFPSIKRSTLWNYVKLKKDTGNVNNTIEIKTNDTKKVFSSHEEDELAAYLETAARLHYGLTKNDARSLAFQYAKANNIEFPEKWNEGQTAGKEWLRCFLKRRETLSLRKPEATSLARSTSFNKENVKAFFDNLTNILSRYEFPPNSIYNLDETGNSTVHVPPKIIAPKGVKQIGSMSSGERGLNVTMIACVSAAGNHVSPMLIFPRKNFKQHMLNGSPPGSIGGANPSGWSTEELFMQYLDHFINQTKPSKEQPVILILDNHSSHISINAINKAKESGVYMLTFPPHTSHKLQPLDRTVFGPYKQFYNKAVSEWMLTNPGKPLSIYEVAQMCGKAYMQAFTLKNITKGFEVSGIFPLNENIFGEEEFLPSFVTDRPCPENLQSMEQEHKTLELSTPSTSKQIECPILNSPAPVSSKRRPTISPHVIRPFPKAPPRKSAKGQRKKGKTMIMTDTPVKRALEEELEQKNKPKVKKAKNNCVAPKKPKTSQKQKVKKVLYVSSSEEDEDLAFSTGSEGPETVEDLVKDMEMEEEENKNEEHFLASQSLRKGDFVLVKLAGKQSVQFFVAEITGLRPTDEHEFEVKYLKRVEGTNKFVYGSQDFFYLCYEDIEKKLPAPTSFGGSERQVSQLIFSVDFSFYNVK